MTLSYTPATVREVLLLLLAADTYPHEFSHDWRTGDRIEAETVAIAGTAIAAADDPPEFGKWLGTLLQPNLTYRERGAVYFAMRVYFGKHKNVQRPKAASIAISSTGGYYEHAYDRDQKSAIGNVAVTR
jgi:hypothetical protein